MAAVLALLNGRTAGLGWVLCKVVLAAFFGNAVGFGKGVDAAWIAAVARASGLAVDDDLRRKSDVRPSSVSGNVDPICDGAGRALRPARTAVSGNMLVFGPGKVVYA